MILRWESTRRVQKSGNFSNFFGWYIKISTSHIEFGAKIFKFYVYVISGIHTLTLCSDIGLSTNSLGMKWLLPTIYSILFMTRGDLGAVSHGICRVNFCAIIHGDEWILAQGGNMYVTYTKWAMLLLGGGGGWLCARAHTVNVNWFVYIEENVKINSVNMMVDL